MARPYPNNFDKGESSPMSAGSSNNTPISYRANVNRQKTKKWADAKPADYGGDDWGDDDEYDLPPPPITKPTGLRQQGQALQHGPKPDPPRVDDKKSYSELPPLPDTASSLRPRANSFDAGDEKRNFSSGTVRQPSPAPIPANTPATRFSQITGVPSTRVPSGPPALSISTQLPAQPTVTGLRKAVPAVSPSGSPHPEILVPGRMNTGESSSIVSPVSDTRTVDTRASSSDYQARRDFSPSAVPHPLQTRASPAPPSATDSTPTKFPARKSSLSQVKGPDPSDLMKSPDETTPKPWVGGRPASPGAVPRSPATQAKALPFIRPADIYKRMEEEREKERQSMDSSRPSLDSIAGLKSSDRSDSPAKAFLQDNSSTDSLGTKQRASFERDDTSESGRLRPTLEPVKERKSEYGFEGFNVENQAHSQGPNTVVTSRGADVTGHNSLDVERERRQSTSPKLPDLNRISGFGPDLFSDSKMKDAEQPQPRPSEITSIGPLNKTSPSEGDSALRNQPSLGFKSVVNQAFDRSGDSSLPATPASRSGSGIRRTDSESTGTTGISPIMSRVPSTAVPESRNRDAPNATTLETVKEPSSLSPVTESVETRKPYEQSEPPIATFKPGHRRDISTPSPGNSPAKTPDLAKPDTIPHGHQAIIQEPSSSTESRVDDDEPLQPPRPIAEREQSFRPVLPGGWTSYATTARSETPQRENVQILSKADHTQIPATQDLSVEKRRHADDDYDITPTTNKHTLPQSELEADVAGASLGSLAGTNTERHDEDIRTDLSTFEDPSSVFANSRSSAPGPTIAPSGTASSRAALDPEHLPKLEHVSPRTQLRPDTIDQVALANTSEVPTPPAKDTPASYKSDKEYEYFNPTAPQEQNSTPQIVEEQILEPPESTFSKDTGSQDDKNDKIRKEIVKSLSPKPSGSGSRAESRLSDQFEDQSRSNQARESSYLPSEYDNYWASAEEEEAPVMSMTSSPHVQGKFEVPVPPVQSSTPPIVVTNMGYSQPEPEPIPPLSPQKADQTLEAPRPPFSQRFSWEASTEDVSMLPAGEEPLSVSTQDQVIEGPTESKSDNQPVGPPGQEFEAQAEALRSHPPSSNDLSAKDTTLIAGGVALAGATAARHGHHSQQQGTSDRHLSLAEEKDPQVSSYPVSPTPPEHEHPARTSQPYFSPISDQQSIPSAPFGPSAHYAPSAPPSSVSPSNSPIAPQFSPSRILAFKEIAAIKSSHQRIQTFDETRHRFAAMDSGLTNWMEALIAQYPEHHGVTATFATSSVGVPAGSARSKFSKGTGVPPQAQQPYYQQYLNASNPSVPGTPASRPGPSLPVGSQQGFSPASGSKLTTQQVQAKGKEFLHTAGIFGGKAGKAGKGLLAKGKNKLRGAGGGDKNQNSASPTAKVDRRSSWGLPLGITRSSGKPDGPSSRESTPTPMPTSQRQRAATLTLDTSQSVHIQTPPNSNIMSAPANMTGPRTTANRPLTVAESPILPQLPRIRQAQPQQQLNSVQNLNENESQDQLGVPAPIGKNQPSWDPFNSTPIVEEEAYHYEEHQFHPAHPTAPSTTLLVPTETASNSERSNSGNALFYDAPEEPSDNEWIMVSNEVEPQQDILQQSRPHFEELQPQAEPRSKVEQQLISEAKNEPKLEIPKSSDIALRSQSLDGEQRNPGDSYTSILNRPRGSYDIPRPSQETGSSIQARNIPPQKYPPPINTSVQQYSSSQIAQYEEPKSTSSFKGLPPIRRISQLGFSFSPRQPKTRFPIEDDDDTSSQTRFPIDDDGEDRHAPPQPYSATDEVEDEDDTGLDDMAGMAYHEALRETQQATKHAPQQSQGSASQQSFSGPLMSQPNTTQYSQQTTKQQHEPKLSTSSSRGGDIPSSDKGFRRSQDAWRPNVVTPPSQASPSKMSDVTISPQRFSFEGPSSRGPPKASHYSERTSRPAWIQPPKSFEQPPSSAQRYPELFRPEQPDFNPPQEGGDLPSHYYQAPIPREAAFLPRQQTNEYQLPGVGPPPEEPRPRSRRNSGFLQNIGDRIRSASRERGNSISRDGALTSPGRTIDSPRGYDDPESSVTSEEAKDQKNRRNSFFNGFSRGSMSTQGPPQSRESMVAHPAGSRMDLLLTPQPSPIATHDRKRSFFGHSSTMDSKPKLSKLARASTGALEEPGKKKRFSGLSSILNKTSNHAPKASVTERPQATRQLPHHERQPIESPAPDAQQFSRQPQPQPSQLSSVPTQHRNFLSRLATGSDSSQPRQDSKTRRPKLSIGADFSPRQESKTRKPAGSGFINGIMGRRSNQQEQRDDSSSQGTRSQASQPQYRQQVPPPRTYTDLQEDTTPVPKQNPPFPSLLQGSQVPERGRRTSRERQYPSVPIPGGYSLVRGEGAIPVPTDYDPRGLNRLQQIDPRYIQQSLGNYHNMGPTPSAQLYSNGLPVSYPQYASPPQVNGQGNLPQNPGAVESFESYQRRSPRRIRREDILARSPARSPEGQQRPYQLSLPENEEDREPRAKPLSNDVPIISPPSVGRSVAPVTQPRKSPNSTIRRLTQPALRHPDSPAGYPLPDDSVFSPVNPSAVDFPPPPPPKWPQLLDIVNSSSNADLERSNTHKTGMSGVSQVSGTSGPQGMLAVDDALHKEMGGRLGITPSPSPPSPGLTPPPPPTIHEPQRDKSDSIKTTTLDRRPNSDLYDASPRLPKELKFGNSAGSKISKDVNPIEAKSSESASGTILGKENKKPPGSAELETTEPDPHLLRRNRSSQEEKIFYEGGDRLGIGSREVEEEHEPAAMSATSYPGQEWNPYAGGYDDGFD